MKKLVSVILITVILSLSLLSLSGCGEKMGTGACDYLTTRDIEGREVVFVEMCVKNYGKMVILLDRTTAPITVDNFVSLVNEGFYDGLTFHRVMEGFMIQGGDPEANGMGNSGTTIKGEFSANGHYNDIKHIKGVISMARGGYSYDSASCQFFICNDTSFSVTYSLDGQYAAFGYVVEGLSVVDDITEGTLKYATGSSNTIENKKNQAVIKYIKVLEDYELPAK